MAARLAADESFWQRARTRYLIRKPPAVMRRDAERTGLARTLTAGHLVALGVGAVIGAGIFTIAGVATVQAGPAVILSFVVAGIVCAIAGLAYAEMASMLPLGGSAYTYAYASFGELVAWVLGWALVLEYAIGNMAVASGFSANVTPLLDSIGVHLPDALRAAPCFVPPCLGTVGVFDLPAFLVVLGVTLLLLRPVHENARVNMVLVVTKVIILCVFLAVALPSVNAANLTPFAPFGATGVFTAAALIFFSFIGFDAVSTAAEETKDPQRDMPRGILGSLAVCTLLYLLVGLAMTGAVNYQQLASREPLATTLHAVGRDNLALLMNVGGLVATLSVLLAFQLGTSRIFLNFARDGMIPTSLVRIHPKFRTPTRITVIIGLFVAIGAAEMPVTLLANLTNIGTLFAFAIVLGGVVILRKKEPDLVRPFRMPLSPWLPIAGIAMCLGLIYFLGLITWVGFVWWLGLGLVIYSLYGARNSRLRAGEVVLEESLDEAERRT